MSKYWWCVSGDGRGEESTRQRKQHRICVNGSGIFPFEMKELNHRPKGPVVWFEDDRDGSQGDFLGGWKCSMS